MVSLDRQIKELQSELHICTKKEPNFAEALKLTLKFLGTPAETWKKADKERKIMVHRLIFTENPKYSHINGFGTPKLSLPFYINRLLTGSQIGLVDPRGVEGASAVSINTLRLNSQQLTSVSCSLIELYRLSFWGSTPSQFVQ